MTERLHFHFSLSCIGEGNGKPLQCSCLENPRDGGSWWAAVYGVTPSRTRLKWLSSSSSIHISPTSSGSLPLTPSIPSLWVISEHRAELPVLSSSSHWLSVLHMTVYICQSYNLFHPPCPLLCVHISILYVCISIPAPQIGLSVSFF